MVLESVRYPVPKSPYSLRSSAMVLSRVTFAMMLAAETIG